jgi:signal transduction histidine kinase
VREILDFMSISVASREIEIEFNSTYDSPSLFDPDLIKLPFMNFLSNAVEAIGEKGRIVVQVKEDGGHVQVVFADNGMGMNEETRKNIFNPFFTTKDKGVGLGLFIAHNIIKAHHGYIEVESAEGKGSSFVICLPKGRS